MGIINTDVEYRDDVINSGDDESVGIKEYEITSYGIDFDVRGLVTRIENEDIVVPDFQREFVWDRKRSSRFIESLLVGLPVPGIFLYRETGSEILTVIDGQQRLLSLKYFYSGKFRLDDKRLFKLVNLESRFKELAYKDLSDSDRRTLDNAIIHATVIRQNAPDDEGNSKYYVFERLNTEVAPLYPHEIRSAIFQGDFNNLLNELNKNISWRTLMGGLRKRKRGEELILRFLALYFDFDNYQGELKKFLNSFMKKNRNLDINNRESLIAKFEPTVDIILDKLGSNAFSPNRQINAAVLDAVMIGITRRLDSGQIISSIKNEYKELLANEDFSESVSVRTSQKDRVRKRIELATEAFANVE